jgi:thiamine pyrophosphate-dependent acetolactate synthase large subunit-like protein
MEIKDIELPQGLGTNRQLEWNSDIAAEMLRLLEIPYISMNPGASYRGFEDSLVNYLGNRAPQMLLCLHEDHVVSIAHGYAKATDRPMACVLHSNVGLMHGLMGLFNAWCDRVPMLVLGATGPIESEKRRPWIDWIHTAKDQGAMLRNFTKWDDEPRSSAGIVEAFLRAAQMTAEVPRGPVYICLDAGLQEKPTDGVAIPDPKRYRAGNPPGATQSELKTAAALIVQARKPVFLFGRGSRRQVDWDRRVALAELVGASVLTAFHERAVFPTDHGLHIGPPVRHLKPSTKEMMLAADLVISFDWLDLNGLLQKVVSRTDTLSAKVIHVSVDSELHNGWSMDYFGLPPSDVRIKADVDIFVEQVLSELKIELKGSRRWDGKARVPQEKLNYSEQCIEQIAPTDIEVALAEVRGDQKFTLAHLPLVWSGAAYRFREPLDYLGHDGGGGLSAGPGLTIGAALALKNSKRSVISVLGDGDFLQGATALWTAAHYRIPALFIVSNNRSNYNDEIHQNTIAGLRKRPRENAWIGQRISDPEVNLSAIANGQGVEGEGPIKTVPTLLDAIRRGLDIVRQGRPYFIDAHVTRPPHNEAPTGGRIGR